MKKHRTAYFLSGGNSWNPLKKFPRNAPCFCGSEKKFKKCCEPKTNHFVQTDDVPKVKAFMEHKLAPVVSTEEIAKEFQK